MALGCAVSSSACGRRQWTSQRTSLSVLVRSTPMLSAFSADNHSSRSQPCGAIAYIQPVAATITAACLPMRPVRCKVGFTLLL